VIIHRLIYQKVNFNIMEQYIRIYRMKNIKKL
jgi:hypothetical protein